jgi:uncharacterized protein
MSVKLMEQEAEYVARLELARRQQTLAAQARRAAEEERQRVCTVAQQHCPTCATPLVRSAYRGRVIDKCSHCQGVWLDGDDFLCFGEALEHVLAKDQWCLGVPQRLLT